MTTLPHSITFIIFWIEYDALWEELGKKQLLDHMKN